MAIRQHKDFCDFLDDIKFLKLQGMVSRLKTPEWKIHTLNLGEFGFQYASGGGGLITNGKLIGDGRLLHISIKGSCNVNGKNMSSDSVLICFPDFEYVISFNDVHEWLNLFIPIKMVKPIFQKNGVSENNHPSGVVRVGKETVCRLKKLLLEILGTNEKAGDSQKGLAGNGKAQKDILAVYEIIALQPPVTEVIGVGRRLFDRDQIMQLINNKLQSQSLDKLFVEDLAIAANVSGRTLRKIFIEYFGVSPLRYLTIYKMHAARKVLQVSNPLKSTVSNIASQFGFRHFGRFASSYRDLFGELPLDTLNNNYKK